MAISWLSTMSFVAARRVWSLPGGVCRLMLGGFSRGDGREWSRGRIEKGIGGLGMFLHAALA